MRFAIIAVFATIGSLAAGQSLLGSFPKCAQDCFGSNYGSCNPLDFACICGNQTLIGGLSCCVFKTCNPDEQNTIIKTASSLCKANNVDLPTSASCPATASPTPSASSSPNSNSNSTNPSAASGATTTRAPTSSGSGSAVTQSTNGAAGPLATAGFALALGVAGFFV